MRYINPFALFESIGQSDWFDRKSIRQVKKRLIQDFDLSEDGTFTFGKLSLHKSDVMPFLDELDDERKYAFHICICAHRMLCDFLMGMNSKLDGLPSKDEIEDSESGIIEYISAYFSEVYGEALVRAVKSNDIPRLNDLLKAPMLVTDSLRESCYTATHRHLESVLQEFKDIERKLDSNDYHDIAIAKIPQILEGLAKVEVLNCLPTYFQEQRNRIAETIRGIAISLQKIELPALYCFSVLAIAKKVNTDGLVKSRIEKDFAIAESNAKGERPARQQSELRSFRLSSSRAEIWGCLTTIAGYAIVLVVIGVLASLYDSCSGERAQRNSHSAIQNQGSSNRSYSNESPTTGKLSVLSSRIDGIKLQLSTKESNLTAMSTDLDGDDRRLRSLKRQLESYEARSGYLSSSEISDYDTKIEEHNRLANRYNSKLALYQTQYRAYKSMLDSVNVMIDQYNRGK